MAITRSAMSEVAAMMGGCAAATDTGNRGASYTSSSYDWQTGATENPYSTEPHSYLSMSRAIQEARKPMPKPPEKEPSRVNKMKVEVELCLCSKHLWRS